MIAAELPAHHPRNLTASELAWNIGQNVLPDAHIREALAELERRAQAYDRIDTPEIDDFLEAVRNEALHQRTRDVHDERKTAADWFWTLGYLMGKALHDVKGKRIHHIITSAALLLNWHSQETGHYAVPPQEPT